MRRNRAVVGAVLLTLTVMALLMTGCWDRIEIEDRSFVIAVAIDFPDEDGKDPEEEKEEEEEKPDGRYRFLVTYQIPITSQLPGGSGQGGGGGGGEKAYFNISAVDETMYSVHSLMSTKLQRTPFFEHLKVILISEEVARSEGGFANVLDYFLRDQEMRRNVKIMITKGKARDVLTVEPPNELLPGMYLESLGENMAQTARMRPGSRIGDVHEFLLKEQSFVLQHVSPGEKEANVSGGAVFGSQDNRLVGFLNEEETEGLNFMTGRVEGGTLELQLEDNMASFEIERAERTVRLERGPPMPKFVIHVRTEGSLIEMYDRVDLSSRATFSMMEAKVEEEIVRLCEDAIDKLQNEYRKDVIGLGVLLDQDYHSMWRQVRNDWDREDNVFARSEIEVHAEAYLRRNGTVEQTEAK
ncbi:Ger(x)C family spore germination protein [Paenibacillus sp. TRM 82003]|nr:Ger(x)C family spore germination protein [Paenibacillus sp. TRM 82003]